MENSGKKVIRATILWLAVSLSCFVPSALADAPSYKLANGSKLGFVATQNGAPVKGEFNTFLTAIKFAPDKLESSSIRAEIELGTLSMGDSNMAQTLKMTEWFSVGEFPVAIYQSSAITKGAGKDDYIADGALTLRGVTLPLKLYFHMDELSDTSAKATGHADLLRNDFGVGQGEWAATDAIKNEVRVEFIINATKE